MSTLRKKEELLAVSTNAPLIGVPGHLLKSFKIARSFYASEQTGSFIKIFLKQKKSRQEENREAREGLLTLTEG